jgi:hypothetical protein
VEGVGISRKGSAAGVKPSATNCGFGRRLAGSSEVVTLERNTAVLRVDVVLKPAVPRYGVEPGRSTVSTLAYLRGRPQPQPQWA